MMLLLELLVFALALFFTILLFFQMIVYFIEYHSFIEIRNVIKKQPFQTPKFSLKIPIITVLLWGIYTYIVNLNYLYLC